MNVTNETLVGTDIRDKIVFPASYDNVHRNGIIHRAVHLEIYLKNNNRLVWKRNDGRLEIPGGHVVWDEKNDSAETYTCAAAREITEELNLEVNWQCSAGIAIERITNRLKKLVKIANQLPSSSGINNEWVQVYCLEWNITEDGDPQNFVLGHEGNSEPEWCQINELANKAVTSPKNINSALRLMLLRNGILIPLSAEVLS